MNKSFNTKDLIAKRYGEEGTKERKQFRENAFAYYFGEIIKSRRKELNLSQEKLAASSPNRFSKPVRYLIKA